MRKSIDQSVRICQGMCRLLDQTTNTQVSSVLRIKRITCNYSIAIWDQTHKELMWVLTGNYLGAEEEECPWLEVDGKQPRT